MPIVDQLFKRSRDLFSSFNKRSPDILPDRTLLDYHRKTHMLYAGNVKRNPPNKQFINSIVSYHNRLVREMESRGMKHTTPLSKI